MTLLPLKYFILLPIFQKNINSRELKQFHESKTGVKGLVDKGLTTIPTFFVHQSEPNPKLKNRPGYKHSIPVGDFSATCSKIIEQVHNASTTLGFFQIINHFVHVQAVNKAVNSIKAFNKQEDEVKMKYYSVDISQWSKILPSSLHHITFTGQYRDSLSQLPFQHVSEVDLPNWTSAPICLVKHMKFVQDK
ncbi:hypothetical protein P3S68_021381 [Capsicum galapagoense]